MSIKGMDLNKSEKIGKNPTLSWEKKNDECLLLFHTNIEDYII